MEHHGDHAAAGRNSDLFRAVLAGGAIFLLWRAARGLRNLAWTAFGLGMAAYWTGFRPW